MDELIDELRRIVKELEAQNAFNEQWMALNTKWHEENEQNYQERLALDREAERHNEQRYQEHSARENKITMAYIDSLIRKVTSDEHIQPVSEVGNQENRAEA